MLESTLATFERYVVGCRRISDAYPDKQLTDRIEGKGNCETAVQRPWLFPISFELLKEGNARTSGISI